MPLSFDLELTARCNNNCRHCYINLPASSPAQTKELTAGEVERIAGEAVSMGAVWCLLTGGEPLLRKDFLEIYLALRTRGLLVSVFTNACLVTGEHLEVFKKHPPRDIEVTVYGVTREAYEKVTRRPGSYASFSRGLSLLFESGARVRLKAMALRSNQHEWPAIADFCREHTTDHFRWDPLLHMRLDGDLDRNQEINSERLSPKEIASLEGNDPARQRAIEKRHANCQANSPDSAENNQLFRCRAGQHSFSVSYNGLFRLCSSLVRPDCVFDLRIGTLADAWGYLVPRVREMRVTNSDFLRSCHACALADLCMWCPARSHLECGETDGWNEYFCRVAHARASALGEGSGPYFSLDSASERAIMAGEP